MTQLLSTREVASLLGIHEKKVYKLITEKNLPATKVTGKWLFPRHLVEHWIENNTVNYPANGLGEGTYLMQTPSLFVIAGSNDVLLDKSMDLFMKQYPEYTVVFGNLGSLGGLKTLKRGLCHIATSHLMQDDNADFNFSFADQELDTPVAVVNFCFREQGLIVAKGNPKNINGLADLGKPGISIVNRPLSTGTRLWFDKKAKEAGVNLSVVAGYDQEMQRHLDVGLAVLSGRADAGPAIRVVADLLDLDFVPMHWERFDFLIPKTIFFDKNIQSYLSLLTDPAFQELARDYNGYDFSKSGKMIYPADVSR